MLRKPEETRIRRRKDCFDCFSLGLAFSKRAERRLASASTHLRRFRFICPLRKSLTKRRNRNKLHSSFRHSRETPLLGSLAQSVEQRTFNPLVERSSRSRPTTFKTKLPRCFFGGAKKGAKAWVSAASRLCVQSLARRLGVAQPALPNCWMSVLAASVLLKPGVASLVLGFSSPLL